MRRDITEFGAVGDGKTLCTLAFERAIAAVAKAGGGTVTVPPGVFLTGTVALQSRITLELEAGAVLRGSPRLEGYRAMSWGQHIDRTPWHLLVAHDCHDIRICGGGKIDGNGPSFWEPVVGSDPLTCVPANQPDPARAAVSWIQAHKEKRPSPMIEITGCRDVRIENIQITNSAGWNLHLHNCNFVWVRGVKLTANLFGPNNDGFDITGCQDVMVSDCYLSCWDDAICLKTTPDSQSCERITVTNCVIRTNCVGFKLGCAESFRDFRQITFSNSIVFGSHRAIAFYVKEGATAEDITISNIVCDTNAPLILTRPIHMELQQSDPARPMGRLRNINISNVVARTDGRIIICAQQGGLIENVLLRDIRMIYPTVDDPALCAPQSACEQNCKSNPDARAARAVVVLENVAGFTLDNLVVQWPMTDIAGKVNTPKEWHRDVRGANGMFATYFERQQFNSDSLPPMSVLWARNVQRSRVRAIDAMPTGTAAKYQLADAEIATD